MGPGATTLTRIFLGANSVVNTLEYALKAPLVALYIAAASNPFKCTMELLKIMAPPSLICGMAFFTRNAGPLMFMLN